MPDNALIFAAIPLAIVAVLGGLAFFIGYRGVLKRGTAQSPANRSDRTGQVQPPITDARILRDGARLLSRAPDERAVLVQFVDAASGDCRRAQPFVDDLRAEFSDRVTFLVRYFPQHGDPVSKEAAVVLEAAAQQDKFDEMLSMMYRAQPQWAGTDEGADAFRRFATELELDMGAFDQTVADPGTTERVEADHARGIGLGVRGAPTFFLLDRDRAVAASPDQFRQLVAKAAAGT